MSASAPRPFLEPLAVFESSGAAAMPLRTPLGESDAVAAMPLRTPLGESVAAEAEPVCTAFGESGAAEVMALRTPLGESVAAGATPLRTPLGESADADAPETRGAAPRPVPAAAEPGVLAAGLLGLADPAEAGVAPGALAAVAGLLAWPPAGRTGGIPKPAGEAGLWASTRGSVFVGAAAFTGGAV